MDTRKLLEMLTRNPAAGAAMGGLAGSLLGNVLGGGSGKGSKKLVKYGGLAAIGYVAYQAWQKNQAQQSGGLPQAGEPCRARLARHAGRAARTRGRSHAGARPLRGGSAAAGLNRSLRARSVMAATAGCLMRRSVEIA